MTEPAPMMTLLPDDEWQLLFSPDGLQRFTPSPGRRGFAPMVEVHFLDTDGKRASGIGLIEADFDDQAQRFAVMEEIGASWAAKAWRVYAVVFAAEAWARTVSMEEWDAGVRPNKTYADKVEVLAVSGLTLDGRVCIAQAPINRDRTQRITGLGTWTVQHGQAGETLQVGIVVAAWNGYLSAARARLAAKNN